MQQDNLSILDNPVWNALRTTQKNIAIGTADALRYPAHILPFLGIDPLKEANMHEMKPYIEKNEKLFVLHHLPAPASWCSVLVELDVLQMVCQRRVQFATGHERSVIELYPGDADEMFELVNAVQPGYYRKQTPLLGSYYGIREKGKLVAIAGERFRMTGLTEVSAVCTDPAFTGRGFAQCLVALVSNKILERGELPFLHVLNSNTRAVRLYELAGFVKRRHIPCWQVVFLD